MNIDKKIADDLVANDVSFVTTVPCKQLAGVIDEIENRDDIFHIPSNIEDEGMGLGQVLQSAIDSDELTIIVCKCDSGNIKLPVITMDPVVIRHRFMEAVAK